MEESGKVLGTRAWVVQTTSVGLKDGDPSPIPLDRVRRGTWVVDLLYHRETAFLKAARTRGAAAMGGLGMLLYQGALSLELWTGRKAPLEVMRRALLECLSKDKGR